MQCDIGRIIYETRIESIISKRWKTDSDELMTTTHGIISLKNNLDWTILKWRDLMLNVVGGVGKEYVESQRNSYRIYTYLLPTLFLWPISYSQASWLRLPPLPRRVRSLVFTLRYVAARCDVNCLQKRSSTAQSIALISYFDFLPSASPVRLRSLITVLCLFAPSPSASTEARTVVTNYCCRAIHPAGTVDGEQKMRTQNTYNRLRIVNSRVLLRFEPAAGCCGWMTAGRLNIDGGDN